MPRRPTPPSRSRSSATNRADLVFPRQNWGRVNIPYGSGRLDMNWVGRKQQTLSRRRPPLSISGSAGPRTSLPKLSNAEWLESAPGTAAEKNVLLGCTGCHTLERVMRSQHSSDDFIKVVLPRMQGYVNQSTPLAPQLRKGERLMEERGDQRVQVYKALGDYLARLNLSAGPGWNFELKTFSRPKGRATRVVYTEGDPAARRHRRR